MSKKEYRTKYYEFTPEWSGFNIQYHLAGYFDEKPMLQIYFIWGKLFLYLPWRHYKNLEVKKDIREIRKDKISILTDKTVKIKKKYTKKLYDQCNAPIYGVYFHGRELWINYGKKYKSFDLPWYQQWVRTSCLANDCKSWYSETRGKRNMEFWDSHKWKDFIFSETHPYKYSTKYGDVQNCLATIRVKEREWRWKWFTWLKFNRLIRKDIEIEFSDDTSHGKSNWTSSTTACSYTMKKGETPYDTLKRMEIERKF